MVFRVLSYSMHITAVGYLLLLVLDAFGAARAHVADLFTCEIGGNLPILPRRTKTPIASSTFVRSNISHKVGCKCLLRCTSIGINCLLPPQLPYLSNY